MTRERLLITVKTYPTLSRKYGETVCTAGVRSDGSWLRIYPVPFRRLEEAEQYKKFDWLECDLSVGRHDPRPETRHPANITQLQPVDHIGTSSNWRERRQLLLRTCDVYTRLKDIIAGAKANTMSLAVFRPTKLLDFVWEAEDREWDPGKVAELRERDRQGELFGDEAWRTTFRLIPKLPFSFSYRFEDEGGQKLELPAVIR